MIDGANIAWNDVQFEAFLLSQVVAKTPMDLADAMFFALTADSAQRGITMAAAKSAFVEHLDLPERIELMLNSAGRTAGDRNAAIHSMWTTHLPEGARRR